MSGSAQALSVTISARDRASGPLRQIAAAARLPSLALGRLSANVRSLGDVTGATRLAAGLRSVGRVAADLAPPLAALAGIGTIAGIVRMTTSWAAFGSRLATEAARLQMTAGQLQALQGAAVLAGGSAEGMTSSLQGLGQALSDAVGGRNAEALQYLRLLGIRLHDANGQARTAAEVLPEVADQIARIRDPRLQGRVLGALGISPDMLPLLQRGSAGLRELTREARRYGVISDEGVARAEAARVAQAQLVLASQGLVAALTVSLAPALTNILRRMTDWITSADGGQAAVQRIAAAIDAWMASGGPKKLAADISGVASATREVVDLFGGWKNAAIALGAALTLSVLSPLAGIASRLTALAAIRLPVWLFRLVRLLGLGGSATVAGIATGAWGAWQLFEGLTDRSNPLSSLNPFLNRQLTPGGGVPSSRLGAGPADSAPTPRQRQAYEYFLGRGYTPEQAAGIVANLRHESGANLDHQAVGDNGRAYGVAQWHPERQEDFRRWSGRSIRESSFEDQLGFIEHELRGSHREARMALLNARTAAEAAAAISLFYEKPAGRFGEAQNRANTAEGMLPRLRQQAAPQAPVPPAAAPQSQAAPAARVDITLRGAPPGTTAEVRSAPGLDVGAPRIERAMPGSGP
ncbi:phage tail tip lysozyme [Pseudoroseomonas cervicalis]|uniref:phage tail tip lysozyme n=1 Tax=Teichococcus cervicalis TaxID=204525 RepID=UPI0022F149C9|nr:phage tail tip lysozyme [Pseudoroseomonas cervicalis]WBV42727.1 phage tail tip lysozyme [Pseudoroseomonas cervicalis]